MVKILSAMRETLIQSLGQEDPMEKEMAVHSSILAWEIPWREDLQCMKVKSESEVAQSCPTLSNPMDCSLPGASIHGIFQARVLDWIASAFSSGI